MNGIYFEPINITNKTHKFLLHIALRVAIFNDEIKIQEVDNQGRIELELEKIVWSFNISSPFSSLGFIILST